MVFINKELKKEKKICTYISLLILGLFLTNILSALSSMTGITASQSSLIIKLLLASSFIMILPIILQRFTIKMLIVTLVSILVTLLNLLFFQKTINIFLDTVLTYFTMCFTGFFAMSSVRDKTILKESLLKISRIIALIGVVLMIGIISGMITGFSNGRYNMGLGYSCLTPLLCLICAYIEKRIIYDVIGILGLLFLVISYGSRGPLIGIFLFGVYFLIRYLIANRKYLLCISSCILISLFTFFYQSILRFLIDILDVFGISSRTLNLLVYNFTHDSGRGKDYVLLIDEIVNFPFKIRGINGEYLLIGKYAHNIFVELIYQFGILIGGIAVIFLFSKFIKTLSLRAYNETNLLRWIFFFVSIPQLMVSSTLWENIGFWLWFAMIL